MRQVGEQWNEGIYSSGTRQQMSKNEGDTGEQKQFWGTGNIRNGDFDFREQGNKAIYGAWFSNELRHDKTNKVSVRPAKTQISLGIRPVWSVFSVRMKNAWVLATHWAHGEDWSDWADAQADLSLRWAHTHFVGFVMSRLKFYSLPVTQNFHLDPGRQLNLSRGTVKLTRWNVRPVKAEIMAAFHDDWPPHVWSWVGKDLLNGFLIRVAKTFCCVPAHQPFENATKSQ